MWVTPGSRSQGVRRVGQRGRKSQRKGVVSLVLPTLRCLQNMFQNHPPEGQRLGQFSTNFSPFLVDMTSGDISSLQGTLQAARAEQLPGFREGPQAGKQRGLGLTIKRCKMSPSPHGKAP